jgi:hypothetical protein
VEKAILRKNRFSTMWRRLFCEKNGFPQCGEGYFEEKTVFHIVEKAILRKKRFSTMWRRLFQKKERSSALLRRRMTVQILIRVLCK